MKPTGSADELRLTFYCKSDKSKSTDDCPSFYRVNHGGWVGQGEVRDDQEIRDQIQNLKDNEAYVWFPDDLMDKFVRMYVKEQYGIDLRGEASGADQCLPEHPQARTEG
jgi:hypothetical protein